MRNLIIQRTAESFQPDVFIVDKEPLGLRGELVPTLEILKEMGTRLVLGLRDVMDSPDKLEREWASKDMLRKMEAHYDRVWVYGPKKFWNPLDGLELSPELAARMRHVGFLRREMPVTQHAELYMLPEEFILVTAGGGGDGSQLMEQVLAAREHDAQNDDPIVMVLGPFMKSENRERIRLRASHLSNVSVVDFELQMEVLLQRAVGVVGMCGYNTFCEVISFDRKALFVPRTHPRLEQYIRASRARELGYSQMLTPEEASIPQVMAKALRALPQQALPSQSLTDADLAGLDVLCDDLDQLIADRRGALPLAKRMGAPLHVGS